MSELPQRVRNHVSRFMSYALRHNPSEFELEMDGEGYVNTEALLAVIQDRFTPAFTLSDLYEIVAENDKQRFGFNMDKSMVRTHQGHSVPVTLTYRPLTCVLGYMPEVLYHGTCEEHVQPIVLSGIQSMTRTHVHMTLDLEKAWKQANRHRIMRQRPVVLAVDPVKLLKQGEEIWISDNNVVLARFVPACCITHTIQPQTLVGN